jgi:hypothetical protein
MVRIASFSALIAGLLMIVPAVLAEAEAGRISGVAAKSDRLATTFPADRRLAGAFSLVDVCSAPASSDADSWCRAWHSEAAQSTIALLPQ